MNPVIFSYLPRLVATQVGSSGPKQLITGRFVDVLTRGKR